MNDQHTPTANNTIARKPKCNSNKSARSLMIALKQTHLRMMVCVRISPALSILMHSGHSLKLAGYNLRLLSKQNWAKLETMELKA